MFNQKESVLLLSPPNLLIWLYNEKNKTEYKNSALCQSEKLVSFYALRFIHKSVMLNFPEQKNSYENSDIICKIWTKRSH